MLVQNVVVEEPGMPFIDVATGYAGGCSALRAADHAAAARAISVPTLCIVGAQNGYTTPELLRPTAKRVPGARSETIAGAGHFPSLPGRQP